MFCKIKLLVRYSDHGLNNKLLPGICKVNKWKFIIQITLFKCSLFRSPQLHCTKFTLYKHTETHWHLAPNHQFVYIGSRRTQSHVVAAYSGMPVVLYDLQLRRPIETSHVTYTWREVCTVSSRRWWQGCWRTFETGLSMTFWSAASPQDRLGRRQCMSSRPSAALSSAEWRRRLQRYHRAARRCQSWRCPRRLCQPAFLWSAMSPEGRKKQ